MSAAAAQPLNSLEPTIPATQVVPRVITLANIKKACKAHKEYSAADRARKKKEEAKKAAAMAVFESLLGVKSEDEVRAMSPGEFKHVARRRIRAGLVELRGVDVDVLLDQVIQKSKSERRPSWKDCFVEVLGESAATQITNATPESFSYKFVGAGL